MKTNFFLFSAFVISLTVFPAVNEAFSSSITWTNTAGGNWSEAVNWDPNQVPDVSDIAIITNGGNYTVTIDTSPAVAGLVVGTVQGGSTQYLVGGSCTVNGQITVNPSGHFLLHNFLAGTNVLVGALTQWTGSQFGSYYGGIYGTTTIASNGVLTIDGDASGLGGTYLFGGILTNRGTVNSLGAYIVAGLANVQIENYGTWNEYGLSGLDSGGADFRFDNFGVWRKAADANSVWVVANFINYGHLEVEGGTLEFHNGGGAFTGTGNVVADANLNFYNYGSTNYFTNPTFTGSGKVLWDGHTVCNGVITATNLESHADFLLGTNILLGKMICSGALNGTTTVSSNSTLIIARDSNGNQMNGAVNLILTNFGTVLWTNTPFPVSDSQIFNYGLWDAQSDNSLGDGNGPSSVFNNHGTFRKSSGANTSALDRSIAFNNFGIVDVETGTLAIGGGGTNNGAFNASIGSGISFTEQFGNGYTFNDGASFTGDVSMASEVFVNGHVNAQNLQFSGTLDFGLSSPTNFGELNVSGTVTILNNSYLAATLLNGFLPAANLSFQVMTFAATNGTFTDFSGLNVGNGRSFNPVFTANDLTLVTAVLPPINLICPTNITVTATDSNGAVVFYTVTATGGCSPPPSVMVIPPSGSTFPIGTTIVSTSAGDTCGTTTNCSFLVTINPPASGSNNSSSVAMTILHHFNGADGAQPRMPLVQASNGKLYGGTYTGGFNNAGVIFDMALDGVFSNLLSLDGNYDLGLVGPLAEGADGNLYGSALNGGLHTPQFSTTIGSVFRVSLNGQLTNLLSFNVTNGMLGYGLVRGPAGMLYGTTQAGGTNNSAQSDAPTPAGSIYRFNTNGTLTTLAYLNATNTGAFPQAPLYFANDDFAYGTCTSGGVGFNGSFYSGYGSIFRMSTNGQLTVLAWLQGTNGSTPNNSGLVQGQDGSFYGLTRYGGTGFTAGNNGSGFGTVYRITTNGALTTLFRFNGTNGSQPFGSLIQKQDGLLLGVTYYGGSGFNGSSGSGNGTLFQITTNGDLTTLHLFSGADGRYPSAGLMAASDGNYYGTTAFGGTNNAGTIFRLSFVPGVPLLSIFQSGNSVTVSWPYPSTGWSLQQNNDLTTSNWSASSGVANDGTNNFLIVSPPVGNLFFRLISN